ncbi:ABC transporter ATP-binding protein [Actinobaculum sp. 352]|uniref:ABC transporter ATP-binding protein n=1 Tax=Actinobaculum sp. 352 TaxID=2490946 RepID=UPI000F7F95A3|nr:ABC transporter ATP-binding protein [Actinobaculum sp. 352]RTE50846.1 ABC transporter ATP-binding protein [Actinobaculum sp. 352]
MTISPDHGDHLNGRPPTPRSANAAASRSNSSVPSPAAAAPPTAPLSPHATLRTSETTPTGRLRTEQLSLGYDGRIVARDLKVEIPDGSFTVIIGPNGCGKSTLLRGLVRLLRPDQGAVYLDGRSIAGLKPKALARHIGLLPQSAIAPEGITVADLVARGRYPHQGVFRQSTRDDAAAVQRAMRATNVEELAERAVGELSGGQRQRVWAAMALAQETPLLLLDEPTTYLDIGHQVELLELFTRLNREGTTLVAVLHDLNQAARYASHLIVMKEGVVVAEGDPHAVMTPERIEAVFGLSCVVIEDPVTGGPLVVPRR